MKDLKSKILDYLKLIFITIVIIAIYDGIIYSISHHIATKGTKSVFTIELSIILIVTSSFYFAKCKNIFIKYIFPVIPIISLYILFDIFYNFLLRSPRFSDFENIMTIYDFNPFLFFAVLLFIFSIILIIFLVLIKVKKVYNSKEYWISILVRLILLVSLILLLQSKIFTEYHKTIFNYTFWSHKNTIKNNGKISSVIFYSNQEIENKKLLKIDNNISIGKTLYKNKILYKKNIYCIVLESFINPNYLVNIKYNKNPVYSKLLKYLPDENFSKIISPVYGGNTAQAEFEILTGVKAFSKISTTEFNVLKGNRIDALLSNLKKYNYNTIATIASNSGYFNSNSAYKSLGFDKVIFLEEEKKFKKNLQDKRIFDGDLYDYNLQYIEQYLKTKNKPIFNYILGMYGHMPYDRNKQERPDVIAIINSDNQTIKNITNQFYYRTKALANYIGKILLLDPNSIIIVSSDHLPPILNKTTKYKYDRYTNIALILDNGKPVKFSKRNQYQIPWLVWDILSNKSTKRPNKKTILEKLYLKALNEGI